METDTFPRRDVQAFLSNAVCLKLNVSRYEREATQFGVLALPTLVLVHPNGKTVFKDMKRETLKTSPEDLKDNLLRGCAAPARAPSPGPTRADPYPPDAGT